MKWHGFAHVSFVSRLAILVTGLVAVVAAAVWSAAPRSLSRLHVGTSGSILAGSKESKESNALGTLRDFIKTETGLDNEIYRQKDWRQLAQKMASRELPLGVFQGYEFAWAQARYPALKPLALAVNVYRYPTAYIVAQKSGAATEFSGLQGKTLAITGGAASGLLRLFVDRQCALLGKKPEEFFARTTYPDNVEDALDDAVDGNIQAVAVDSAGLEAFKRRKPGRFSKLKPVVHSKPLPPVTVAYYDEVLDDTTLQRFRGGLLKANQKERGQTLLTVFKLTKFEAVPGDFAHVLSETREAYPESESGEK